MQNGVLISAYLRGINLIRRVIMGGVEYYLFNGHGDVVNLTDESGKVTRYYDYDAFGNEKFPDTTDTNPFRYCGEYFDAETGTYYLRARYYDPEIGRFTQQDSVLFTTRKLASGYEYADPLSLNLYTYCANNPILYCDPSGHALEIVFDIIGIVWSIRDFVSDPSLANAGYLLWDAGATFLPFVTGSYVVKGVDVISKVSKTDDIPKLFALTDNAIDAAKLGDDLKDTLKSFKSATARNFRENLQILTGICDQGQEAHHIFPQKFRSDFKKAGINIDSPIFGSWVDKNQHRGWSSAYNKEWKAFFASVKNPSMDQIVDKVIELSKKYEFDLNFEWRR